jgi:hypothetical protein
VVWQEGHDHWYENRVAAGRSLLIQNLVFVL